MVVSMMHFNPRAPCGARPRMVLFLPFLMIFQPTRPLRGATFSLLPLVSISLYFNPRAPCGARHQNGLDLRYSMSHFNPRAPCGARLSSLRHHLSRHRNFNPRAPCGARPSLDLQAACFLGISTHAPLAGRDLFFSTSASSLLYFNPRAPCGARQQVAHPSDHGCEISTHAPLAGRDFILIVTSNLCPVFQPTRPLRGATPAIGRRSGQRDYFNPRAPCGARL